jgi:LysR family nitrogen assimilation transcriptional regulator
MTPRQLKYFVEIARTGSLTQAAASLHIAQPALSHQLAAMEGELGVALLQRHARGVRLTGEGQRLFDRSVAILRQMDRLREDVLGTGTALEGTVTLCLVGSVAPVLALPLFRALQARAPQVQLRLSTGMSREAQAMVEARRVDLALLPTAFELPRLLATPVFEEDFCLFGHRRLLKGRATRIAFRDIGDRALVAPDRDHDLRKLIERTALAHNCNLNVRYELNNSELLRAMVREGMACAIMPRNAFPTPDLQDIAVREIVEPALVRTQSIVSLVEHPLTPAGDAVRMTLMDLIASLIADGALRARTLR